MATDLFGKYYNNPTKSYIYADILCSNGTSADETSFDFNDTAGEITDNNNLIQSLDLGDVHVGLSQYTSDMRIIEPNSFCYVRGLVFGDAYCTKYFGKIPCKVMKEDEDFLYHGMLFFLLKYLDTKTGKLKIEYVKVNGVEDDEITFIDSINTYMEDNEIPIVASFDDGYVVFTGTKTGYEFWVDHVMFWKTEDGTNIFAIINDWMIENNKSFEYGWDDRVVIAECKGGEPDYPTNVYYSRLSKTDYSRLYKLLEILPVEFKDLLEENNVEYIYLYEDFAKYKPSKKYRNGAMLGCMMTVTYPKYNNSDIDEFQKAVKVAHVVDRVQEFYAIPESLKGGTFVGVRKLTDVNDAFHCDYDEELYHKWMGFYEKEDIDACCTSLEYMPEMITNWGCSGEGWQAHDSSIYRDIEHRDQMGLEGFCAYLSKTGGWMTVGQFYGRTTVPDSIEYPDVKNLIPSFIVYNPNDFPVQIKYLAFA